MPAGTLVIVAFVATAFLVMLAGGLAGMMIWIKRQTERKVEQAIDEKLAQFGDSSLTLKAEFIRLHEQVSQLTSELVKLKAENENLIREVTSLTREVNRLQGMIPPGIKTSVKPA